WQACETAGTALVSVTEPIDTSTDIGVALVRILVTFAGLESTVRSQRLRSKAAEAAAAGARLPGARPYGFSVDNRHLIAAEAAVIAEAAERVLGGESLEGIARDLRRRGVPSPGRRQWSG